LRTNYVFIDYENVQPNALSVLDQEHFKVLVFVGASQTKVSFESAAALQRMGSRAEYIKISANGSNALDFHIAFYIGQLATQDPTAYFHIISKDTGFDPLIQHLKGKKIFAARSKDVADIPLVKAANTKSPGEKVDVIVAKLQQLAASKPRTIKTLSSTISSLFQKQLSEEDVASLVAELQSRKLVVVTDTKVSYAIPPASV
jgi:PIN domain